MSDAGEGEAPTGGSGKGRAQRLPRWTRQEILVLIEGKRVVERTGRGRGRGRTRAGGVGGTAEAPEPTKWAAVAAYCRRHGVDRGPVQCRKRWSNLAGDYKKIREWEKQCAGAGGGDEPSFWALRGDARKERRLPGFFDREVYDILEGRGGGGGSNAAPRVDLAVVGEKPAVLDSGAGAAGVGLFSSSDDEEDEEATPPPAPTPVVAPPPVAVSISEKPTEVPMQGSSQQGTSKRKELNEVTQDSPVHERQKKQRSGEDAAGRPTTDLQGQLIHILDWSGRMLAAQLEAQNINSQLDREQRKDQVSSLLGALGNMADALYRIADKL